MKLKEVVKRMSTNISYMYVGAGRLSKDWDCSQEDIYKAREIIRNKLQEGRRILILPDLHAPFIMDGALEFVKRIYKKYNCNEIYCTGDVVDFHSTSFHETSTNAKGVDDELDEAINQLKPWYTAFPDMKIATGNHDARILRKAQNGSISNRFIKPLNEVLEVPKWEFAEYHMITPDILLCHGLNRKADRRMSQDMINIIQGHYHSESYLKYQTGRNTRLFAMQLGTFLDDDSYAASYGKWNPTSHKNVGILIEDIETGELIPHIEYFT